MVATGSSKHRVAGTWVDEGTIQWHVWLAQNEGQWQATRFIPMSSADHDTSGAEVGSTARLSDAMDAAMVNKKSSASPSPVAYSGTYNRSNAVYYANLYSCNPPYQCRNSAYTSISNDCTSFVSQILRYGGVAIDSAWKPYTFDWVNVAGLELMVYERNMSPGYQLQDKTGNFNNAVPGDGLVYDWGKGDGVSHRALEVGYGVGPSLYGSRNGDWLDQHSTDRYHAPWNYGYLYPGTTVNPSTMRIWKENFYTSYSW